MFLFISQARDHSSVHLMAVICPSPHRTFAKFTCARTRVKNRINVNSMNAVERLQVLPIIKTIREYIQVRNSDFFLSKETIMHTHTMKIEGMKC